MQLYYGMKPMIDGKLMEKKFSLEIKYTVPINTVTTSSTLALTDAGDFLKCTNETAITITIPTNTAVAFTVGTEIIITQYGAGTVTIAHDTGVNMNSLDSNDQIAGQYGSATLKKIGTDEWILVGALTASA